MTSCREMVREIPVVTDMKGEEYALGANVVEIGRTTCPIVSTGGTICVPPPGGVCERTYRDKDCQRDCLRSHPGSPKRHLDANFFLRIGTCLSEAEDRSWLERQPSPA
jgi:hypothetical protein